MYNNQCCVERNTVLLAHTKHATKSETSSFMIITHRSVSYCLLNSKRSQPGFITTSGPDSAQTRQQGFLQMDKTIYCLLTRRQVWPKNMVHRLLIVASRC